MSTAAATERRATYGTAAAATWRGAITWSSPRPGGNRRDWRIGDERVAYAIPVERRTPPPGTGMPARWYVREEDAVYRARFDQAIAALHGELLSYMRRRVGDAETAADLAQETLLRMLRYRDMPCIQDYALLMYRIAHNCVLEH